MSNVLDDDVGLDAMLAEINQLQRNLGSLSRWPPFARRKPLRLREAKSGKWVAYREDMPDRCWCSNDLAEHLESLRTLAANNQKHVAQQRRMDALNARVRELLGDADYEFYTNTLTGYGAPRA